MQSSAADSSSPPLWQWAGVARGLVAESRGPQRAQLRHPPTLRRARADQDSRSPWHRTAVGSRLPSPPPSGLHAAAAFPGYLMRVGVRSAATSTAHWWHLARSRCMWSRAPTRRGKSTAVNGAPGGVASSQAVPRGGHYIRRARTGADVAAHNGLVVVVRRDVACGSRSRSLRRCDTAGTVGGGYTRAQASRRCRRAMRMPLWLPPDLESRSTML